MLATKSEIVVAYEIRMDIHKVSEEILKCVKVNIALYPLAFPGRHFCPHKEMLNISSLSNVHKATTRLLFFFYGAPTPFWVIASSQSAF